MIWAIVVGFIVGTIAGVLKIEHDKKSAIWGPLYKAYKAGQELK